ncbi:unnamed protein product [Polarella glacialis]|uniref:P-type ATPase A domain-containing protein n=1 Tax=Polarella glacialis TaxID=89957 RepID=A0A813F5M2_POLGL|nr:unnamed protein product [Polarella glacialis]
MQALNDQMLGSRVLQAGAAGSKPNEAPGSVLTQLSNADSFVSRGVLLLQATAFLVALTLQSITTDPQTFPFSSVPALFLLTMLLAHALLKRALLSLRAGRISVHVLMLIVLLGALFLGELREAATVALLISASEWILSRAHGAVEAALQQSLVGAATHATRLAAAGAPRGNAVAVRIVDLLPGDVVLLRCGEVIPTDGRVLHSGGLMVDEASVTGEALPADKPVGSLLLSGTLVAAGVAEVECTARAEDSFQGRMQSAVNEARCSSSQTEEFINRFAAVYTPLVVVGSTLLALITGDLSRGLTALVAACPCAIVGAAPVVQACAFVRLLSDLQVLVKNARALEALAQLTKLAVDKTGTLTRGCFELSEASVLAPDGSREELLKLLAAVESRDSHPLAGCLVRSHVGCAAAYSDGKGPAALPAVDNFTRLESMGVWGIIGGKVIGAGSAGFLEAMAIDLPEEAVRQRQVWEATGSAFTPVYMTVDDDVVMVLRLEDEVRADAAAAVACLQSLGIQLAVLSGDTQRAADVVAAQVGIQEVLGKLKPLDKQAWVQRKQGLLDTGVGDEKEPSDPEPGLKFPLLRTLERVGQDGSSTTRRPQEVVGMLGDGLNDGPALAAADVGIAISSGLQLTTEAADVVLGSGGSVLLRFARAVRLARRCRALITQNLVFAFTAKLLALSLAATGDLTLTLGVLCDTGSLLLVLLNSLRPLFWALEESRLQ